MPEIKKPVVRFPPSPTGFLHIGNARTALFNWLYARHTRGRMLLRIEDTDRERSTPEAVAAIFNGLEWLGLDWDGEATYQFARAQRHREVADSLLATGKAYRCFATAEELAELRERQQAAGLPLRYDGRWRDRGHHEAPNDRAFAIRLKTKQTGETLVRDAVLGDVTFQNEQLDDMVLVRSDGTPTYMLAVVVDDHDSSVTHVLRGADHLNNTPRQLQIIRAMEWEEPHYGHFPLIHGPDGAKLSKRHGALSVEIYRDMGYLPETMRNYLLRLGWSHGDDEIISTENAIAWFNLENISKSPARMDFKRLDNLNGHYIRQSSDESLLAAVSSLLGRQSPPRTLNETAHKRIRRAMPELKSRAKTIVELARSAEFLMVNGAPPADENARKILASSSRPILIAALDALRRTDWTSASLEVAAREVAATLGVKLGDVAQPLRAALTGQGSSPPIFAMMEVLGRDESLSRLETYVA